MAGKASSPDLSEFQTVRFSRCKVARLLDELSNGDRINFEAALAAPQPRGFQVAPGEVSDNKIAERFGLRNLRVGANAVKAHRQGRCCCKGSQ